MITRLTHTFIYVLDVERAVDFYTKKLGFIPHTDILVLGERWVTVTPPLQNELQILLVPAQQSMIFETQQALRMQQLIQQQTLSFAVFECTNLLAAYEELKMKGVEFFIDPYENKHLNTFEAAFFDDSGNWFRMTEKNRISK